MTSGSMPRRLAEIAHARPMGPAPTMIAASCSITADGRACPEYHEYRGLGQILIHKISKGLGLVLAPKTLVPHLACHAGRPFCAVTAGDRAATPRGAYLVAPHTD